MKEEIPLNNLVMPSRRQFLSAAGMAAASLTLPRQLRAAAVKSRPFEVSASLYPWDLHDEGIEHILDNLQQMSQVNSVYLLGIMHYEIRPLTSPAYPHNPVRKTWQAEDSRAYWHPDMKRYGRIKPKLSDFDWLNNTDWLPVLTQAARKRGLRTGVELSHTLVDLDREQSEFSDCVQRDIHGVPRKVYGRAYPICPNNPDVQQYVLALFSDLTANYDVDYLQTCTIPFMPGGADKGGCFCDSCMKAAKEHGVDLAKIKTVLLANPEAPTELAQWQAFRDDSLARYYKIMHDGIHAIRSSADLRFNDCFPAARDWKLNLTVLAPHLDSVRVCDYSEQRGNPALMSNKREWLTMDQQALGKDFPVLSAVAVRPKATPELIEEGVKIAMDCGVVGITLGHYDGAEFPMLRAIRSGLAAEKVTVPARLV
jgi:hypothetical protein